MVDLKEEEGRISEDMGETSEEAVEEETAVATPEPEETPKDETKE